MDLRGRISRYRDEALSEVTTVGMFLSPYFQHNRHRRGHAYDDVCQQCHRCCWVSHQSARVEFLKGR
jgi:hypothetical protein